MVRMSQRSTKEPGAVVVIGDAGEVLLRLDGHSDGVGGESTSAREGREKGGVAGEGEEGKEQRSTGTGTAPSSREEMEGRRDKGGSAW